MRHRRNKPVKRRGRNQFLGVRAQRQARTRRRLRVGLGSAVFLLGAAGLILSAWFGGRWLLSRFVFRNEAFAIHRFEVTAGTRLSASPILRWAGVHLGDNLFQLDLARVKRDLEMVPLIREAAIQRVLPDTLRIRVVERVPAAKVLILKPGSGGEGLSLKKLVIDETGFVFSLDALRAGESGAEATWEGLSEIVGTSGIQLVSGQRTHSDQVYFALDFLRSFSRSGLFGRVFIETIDIAEETFLTISTRDHQQVVFGNLELPRQLRRWEALFAFGREIGRRLAFLDVSLPNNLPFRWDDSKGISPAASMSRLQDYDSNPDA